MDDRTKKMLQEIGKQLKSIRKSKGLNQTQVVEQTSLSRKTLSSIENGKNATMSTLVDLILHYNDFDSLKKLGIDITELDLIEKE